MIQIYSKGNTNYDMNGDMVLFPESCKASAELNGTWKMEMLHQRDQEGRWRNIEEECIISAPTFVNEKQLFRICEVEKTDEEINVTALPIFLDSANDCYLMDVRPTDKNGQEALDIMTAGSKYSGESNITAISTAYFVTRSLADAINGSDDPNFIGRWGGELLYDNYKVIINERVGGDYGVEVRYGKNMEGIEYHLDMSGVVTRIIPMAYNGYMISGGTPWVDSPNINKYEKKYIQKIKFEDVKMRDDAQEDDEESGVIICDTQEELDAALTERCQQQFEGGLDLPAVSISITMTDLSGTEEYKDYNILETVGLGDDIACYHKELGITTKERVIEITWDCCQNRVDKVTLGKSEYDYFSNTNSSLNDINSILGIISNTIDGNGSVNAEKVKGFLDATKTQLRLQNSVAKKQIVRAILFEDLDPESELYGAMSLGTQGLQIAKKRTADNRDWDWTTALTANGLIANCILTGILSDKKGLNTWNLDTGEMNMKVMSIVAEHFSLSSGKTIDDIVEDALDGQTQEDIIDKLTNGGKDQGIFIVDGKLYISLDSLKGRVLTLGGMNNENGEIYIFNSKKEVIGKWNNDSLQAIDVDLSGNISMKKIIDRKIYTAKIGEIPYSDNGRSKTGGGILISSESDDRSVAILPNAFVVESTGQTPFSFQNVASEDGSQIEMAFWGSSMLSFTAWKGNGDGSFSSGTPLIELIGHNSDFRSKVGVYMDSCPVFFRGDGDYGVYIYAVNQSTSGWNATLVADGNYNFRLYRGTSSSKRYKDISRDMNENDIDKLYHIQPVLAKYKKGILQDTDERFEKSYPMFIAEDVEKFFPEAVDHNADGAPENWNERIMIPAMFQMIKTQKEAIGNLIKRTKKLESMMELEE